MDSHCESTVTLQLAGRTGSWERKAQDLVDCQGVKGLGFRTSDRTDPYAVA